jgi:hypothetical protein
MNIPRRFFIALPFGFALGISIFTGLLYTQLGIPTEKSHFLFDIIQKQDQLAAKISGNRLLVVAGSSALFGINAQRIEQKSGFPTINMGSHAGLFLDYILYRAKKEARPGDTILLACEYELYLKKWADPTFDDYVLARDPEYFYRLPLLAKTDMATRISWERLQEGWKNRRTSTQAAIPKPPYGPYTPFFPGINSIDDNGDQMFNFEATRPPPQLEMHIPSKALEGGLASEETEGFKLLTAFIKWAQARHITVLATFPNIIYQPAYENQNGQRAVEIITRFYASLGVPVIGKARESMLPFNEFLDTKYHLTHEAALRRTDRLIPVLQPYLPTNRSPRH